MRSDVTGSVIISPRLRDPINTSVGDVVVDGFSIDGYAGWTTDIVYRTDSLGDVGPTFVERSADGDTLTFTFGFPLLLGNLVQEIQQESLFINMLTDAPAFETTGRATFFGRSEAYPDQILQVSIGGIAVPAAARIPLPAPLALMLAGLVGTTLVRRGRNRPQHRLAVRHPGAG